MNNISAMSTPSVFDQLADLHVKVCVDDSQIPLQWIYAIDDAWFHHKGFTQDSSEGKRKLEPVFGPDLSGELIPLGRDQLITSSNEQTQQDQSSSENGITTLGLSGEPAPQQQIEANLRSLFLKCLNDRSRSSGNDAKTASALVAFVQEQASCNYGLCFCTFEYFWTRIREINEPQNAVFFDLQHGLAKSVSDLAEVWRRKLEKDVKLYGENVGDMSRLGWMLHFAYKFKRIPEARIKYVKDNHILIISSAISPRIEGTADGSAGRSAEGLETRDAVSQFLDIQNDIFTRISDAKNRTGVDLDDVLPSYFTYAPLPKSFGTAGNVFRTGLHIFNNSFKNAANWDFIQGLVHDDILTAYSRSEDGHFEPDSARTLALKWNGWIPEGNEKQTLEALYKKQDSSALRIDTLISLLTHTNIRFFPRSWDLFRNFAVRLPIAPGILFVYGLADFIVKLAPEANRIDPKVTYGMECNEAMYCFVIRIKISTVGEAGVHKLKTEYEAGTKPCGATRALLRIGSKKEDSVNHEIKDGNNNKTILGELLKMQTPSFCCPVFPVVEFNDQVVLIKLAAIMVV